MKAGMFIMLVIAFLGFLSHNPGVFLSAAAFALFFAFMDDTDKGAPL